MISDKNLKVLSFCISLVGIIIIYIVSVLTGQIFVEIGTVTESDIGKYVAINGTITSLSTNNGNVFIEINDNTGNITAVIFERTARTVDIYNFKEGDTVFVEGQINIYKGELEIVANSIKLVE